MGYNFDILYAAVGGQALRLFSGWASMSFKAKKLLPFDASQLQPILMAGLGNSFVPALMEQVPMLSHLPPEVQIGVAGLLGFTGQVLSRDATKSGSQATVTTEKVVTKETTTEVPDEDAPPRKRVSTTHRINDKDDPVI